MALTDGSDHEIVSYLASHHREAIPGPAQPPIPFNAKTWAPYIPAALGPALVDLPSELGGSVSREDLARLAAMGPTRIALRRLFVASLIWGLGKKNGRMLPGFRVALEHPGLDRALASSARLIRDGRPGDAYQLWERSRIPGLDEPFFTKWLYAAGLAGVPEGSLKPLVLDANVWRSLGVLGWSSERVSGFKRRTMPAAGYCAYLAAASRWASALSTSGVPVSAEDIERFLFGPDLRGNS
jgi:hypothetical protein